jgi:hypothetical protein
MADLLQLLVDTATALMIRFHESFPFGNWDDDHHEKNSQDSSDTAERDQFIDG